MGDQTHVHFTPEATRAQMARVMKALQNRGYQVQRCNDDDGRDGLNIFSRDGRLCAIPGALRRELKTMTGVAEVVDK